MSDVASSPPIDDHANAVGFSSDNVSSEDSSLQRANSSDPESRWIRRRKDFLRYLLAQLDQLVFIELAGLYYLDNSSIQLIIRSVIQLGIAAPALYPDAFKLQGPNFKHKGPHLILIVVLNIAALLLHISVDPASAGETTRFYLHGSLIIDFIGQRARSGWVGKVRLCILDLVVLVLQLLSCGVVDELTKITTLNFIPGTSRAEVPQTRSVSTSTAHEPTVEGIELQPLLDRHCGTESVASQRRLDDREAHAWHALNTQYAGQSVLFDFNIVGTIVNQYWDYKNRRRIGSV